MSCYQQYSAVQYNKPLHYLEGNITFIIQKSSITTACHAKTHIPFLIFQCIFTVLLVPASLPLFLFHIFLRCLFLVPVKHHFVPKLQPLEQRPIYCLANSSCNIIQLTDTNHTARCTPISGKVDGIKRRRLQSHANPETAKFSLHLKRGQWRHAAVPP